MTMTTEVPSAERQVVDRLRAARERLAQPGVWMRYPPMNDRSHHCAGSAIEFYGSGNEPWVLRICYRLLTEAIRAGKVDSDLGGIVQWNDAEGRTLDQVLAAFDRAIELAEAEAARCT